MARGVTSATPCALRMKGRTKIKNVTKLDTGLPGRPMKNELPKLPKASGRPGFMAMRHMSNWPSASTAGLTKSASPTETPPEVTTTSHSRAARRSTSRVASRLSGTMP